MEREREREGGHPTKAVRDYVREGERVSGRGKRVQESLRVIKCVSEREREGERVGMIPFLSSLCLLI